MKHLKRKELLKPSDIAAEGLNRVRVTLFLNKKSASAKKKAFSSASEAQAEIVKAIQASPGLSFTMKKSAHSWRIAASQPGICPHLASLSGYGGAAGAIVKPDFTFNKGLLGTVLAPFLRFYS